MGVRALRDAYKALTSAALFFFIHTQDILFIKT
jgi:hypothetical protein